jgi:hypothetical protein
LITRGGHGQWIGPDREATREDAPSFRRKRSPCRAQSFGSEAGDDQRRSSVRLEGSPVSQDLGAFQGRSERFSSFVAQPLVHWRIRPRRAASR